ncbi:hypothetical protein [Halomicrococcus sp. NG-SE-24]|uniref:hypothetical protein n=1 Tax=Halomicrococcus sp. NG-SE-24 TaxID=3436928 RepID=UPI003D992AFB
MRIVPQLPASKRKSQVFAVVLVVCLVVPTLASPVLAGSTLSQQQVTTNNSTNGSSGSNGAGLEPPSRFIGNGEADSTANNSTNGSNGDQKKKNGGNGIVDTIGGIGGSVTNPTKAVKGIFKSFLGIPEFVIGQMNNLIFGIPAPGKAQQPGTWSNPESGTWKGVIQFTRFSTVLATVILVFSGGTSFFAKDEYQRRQAWKRWGLGVFAIVLTWTMLPFFLHIANAAASGLRPDDTELLGEFANVGKMSAGLGFTAFIGILQPAVAAVGVAALGLERFLIYLGVGVWPIAWALRTTNNSFAQSIGQTFIYIFGVTVVTKLFQAFIARLLFMLNFGQSFQSTVMTTLMIGVGIAFLLIYFPKQMLDHANDAASVSLGVGAAGSNQVGQYAAKANDRVGQVHEKVEDYRADGGDTPEEANTDRHDTHSDSGSSGGSSSSSDPTSDLNHHSSIDDSAVPDDMERQIEQIERTSTMQQRINDDD